jgi:hypothetical protein
LLLSKDIAEYSAAQLQTGVLGAVLRSVAAFEGHARVFLGK